MKVREFMRIVCRLNHYPLQVIVIFFLLTTSLVQSAPIADRSAKFLGNISNGTPSDNYADYWNQITLENGGKWASVQPRQDAFNWGAIDEAYEYCKEKGFPYKQHCFVWGSQYPGWMNNLGGEAQREAVENWIKAYAERYPETEYIDVVNEPIKTACPFKNALGGNGETGWDWVVTSFELARKYCPNSKLLINEYGIEGNMGVCLQYLAIIKILHEKDLIDGIGIQSHCFNIQGASSEAIVKCLDTLASTGLPLFSSELDITGSESSQLNDYKRLFPLFWEHPAVQGVTLWGWTSNWRGAIIMSGGREYAALQWMRTYVDSMEDLSPVVSVHRDERKVVIPEVVSTVQNNRLHISVNAPQMLSWRIIDMKGRCVSQADPKRYPENTLLSLPGKFLPGGVYTIQVIGGNNRIVQKVLIQNTGIMPALP